MAKVKLLKFELAAALNESKKLVDFLQRFGCTHIENVQYENLQKYDNTKIILQYEQDKVVACNALRILEESCNIKKSIISQFSDYSVVDYEEYKRFVSAVDETKEICSYINDLKKEIDELKTDIVKYNTLINYYIPWETLDLPMSSTCTATTSIFIGYMKTEIDELGLKNKIAEINPELDGIEIQQVYISKSQSCFVVICHNSIASEVEKALSSIGYCKPDSPAKTLPRSAIKDLNEKIKIAEESISKLLEEIQQNSDNIERIKYLIDFYDVQIDKYKAVEFAGTTERIIYFEGYVPQKRSEELKFEVERKFVSSLILSAPDYENENVPVMIENGSFASGVESVTNMYSVPSNKDLDPNPVMAFFYYSLFGLMLSDGGYGILMVIFGALMKWKFKVEGSKLKTANFAFFCGIFTVIWGALFGSWFGDLIPTVCTNFLHMENPPNLTIWFDPKDESMKLLLYSFLFGIIHLFVGLGIRFVTLIKHKDIIGAICDTVPVYVFVSGFAIIGKNFIEPVTDEAKAIGTKLLIAGAILIILTAGRSAKNIFGKLGGGLYGLYNTTTGYMSDILSYSRLLALNLVTGVIAMVVNLLAAMPGNIVIFIVIFLVGHGVNMAINLIGTYVHTNRLQYVEYFSKFYEGGGRSFTPFRLNTQYLRIKEDKTK